MHPTIEQRFSIDYSFPVIFCRDLLQPANEILANLLSRSGSGRHRLLAFVDSGVLQACPDLPRRLAEYARTHAGVMELVAPALPVSGGESCKNDPAILSRLHGIIERHHLCRQSFVLALGGGAVLDAVGFAAATAHRGLRLIRVPTTVLGQNDAGVGVKNSINFRGRKNFLGTFAPPYAVINDFTFLDSLPQRELRAGIVEAVKVALIKDRVFFDYLREHRHRLAAFAAECLEVTIRRCAELHIEHIGSQGDPFEFGSSRPLDFGHWSAHKLEEISGGALNHGEAVAIGIALDTLYSSAIGLLPPAAAEIVLTTLEDLGLTLYHQALDDLEIMGALGEFREHLGGELTIPLLAEPGCLHEVNLISEDLMRCCIEHLADRHRRRSFIGKTLPMKEKQDFTAGQANAVAAGGS
jgi:3-dehydroquinate synthase